MADEHDHKGGPGDSAPPTRVPPDGDRDKTIDASAIRDTLRAEVKAEVKAEKKARLEETKVFLTVLVQQTADMREQIEQLQQRFEQVQQQLEQLEQEDRQPQQECHQLRQQVEQLLERYIESQTEYGMSMFIRGWDMAHQFLGR